MFAKVFKIKTEIPYLHKYSDPLLWDLKLSSGASCFHWSLRCFYNFIGVHLWYIQLIGMIWKGTHPGLYKVPQFTEHVRGKNQAMRSKEFSVEIWDRIVWAKVHIPTGQRRSGFGISLSECPWVAQPEHGLEPDGTSLERPEHSCAATLPIQPDRAWENLQRMGDSPNTGVPSL